MTWDEFYNLWSPLKRKIYNEVNGSDLDLIELLGLPVGFYTDHLYINSNGPLPEDIRSLLETLNNSPHSLTLIKIIKIRKGCYE